MAVSRGGGVCVPAHPRALLARLSRGRCFLCGYAQTPTAFKTFFIFFLFFWTFFSAFNALWFGGLGIIVRLKE